ncbi:glucose-6-phosphate dehydrogenase [Providencia sp. PROV188]|jgi:glucose-6-phosphate 1-dehydrogenase|uniref:Glucose-6-phosphate 1-dehydrogenase n=1 Tax=Providencia alcalifaciens TaxID=126385 RepID=A0A4R3NLY1_9GAMM|nr:MULTISPECIES: glucose-6-phosphate dehydrogenase [Providencia]ETT03404.1 glucose-6-phosphate dehydrogenase [Providencia alcalifaciens PAL-3]EUD00912.1 glucose-6-phosphate dehydrogenase [Providencia alcalifaciens PAL-1]MBC5790332.1 glucose-6-phosphate dehydrogenase [Providencia sp. JUb39]MBG5882033.1 glucose-6-phosphate dehydrogenase [Providencia alcalifaciens]MDR2242440.1 glucose-6-phosphate dehydrogenase [Providencia alcalifaciens]
MAVHNAAQACDLIIFGTKGDLARRKLLPSLYQLEKAGYIHPDTRIIGVGRAQWERNDYVEFVHKALNDFLKEELDSALWERLSARLDFCNLDVSETDNFVRLADMLKQDTQPAIHYFAMPPSTFGEMCHGLGHAGLNKQPNRVVMEKPLGTDLASSQQINNEVAKYFDESQVYRIDHYLGKETVLNLLALRFANSLFINNWDNRTIDHVQITVAEEVGIEGRWGYFDQAGQMRDMVQNHLLQILTMIAMSPPADLTTDRIRDEKVKVLRSLRRIDHTNVREKAVRGQYTAGFVQGKKVPGYLEEEGANKQSQTESFVALRVDIDDWRWAGVPFYLRTGKRLPAKCSEVVVYFKKPALNIFSESYQDLPQNKLTIRLQPDEGIDIEIMNKAPGLDHKHRLQTTKLDLSFSETFNQTHLADAYERLLLEAMRGIQALFVRRDEVEEAWKWVDSIMEAWAMDNDAPKPYQAGTWGPIASVAMIARDGRSWNEFE